MIAPLFSYLLIPNELPVQATTERVLNVDLLGTAYVLEEFGRVIAEGGSGIAISSMAGHMGEGYPREIEHPLAYTPTAELLDLPFLAAENAGDSGAAYTIAKRGNALRVQAAAITSASAVWSENRRNRPGADAAPVLVDIFAHTGIVAAGAGLLPLSLQPTGK